METRFSTETAQNDQGEITGVRVQRADRVVTIDEDGLNVECDGVGSVGVGPENWRRISVSLGHVIEALRQYGYQVALPPDGAAPYDADGNCRRCGGGPGSGALCECQ